MYVYQADTYCDSCGEAIIAELARGCLCPGDCGCRHSSAPWNRTNYCGCRLHDSGDSDGWPQSATEEATDGPDHCASGPDCLEPVSLAEHGSDCFIGALLSDGLTTEGVSYLREMLAESVSEYQRALHRYWGETFAAQLAPSYEVDARKLGEAHGRAAASWYFDGNTPNEAYLAVLRGMDDGDPEVMQSLPSSPLSGEWADDPTPDSVWRELGMTGEEEFADDVILAYEDGFSVASYEEIEREAYSRVAALEAATAGFEFGRAYRADGWSDGVAWRAVRADAGRIIAVMIGDDREHSFEPAELTPLDPDSFCVECGQIDCKWHTADGKEV